MKILEVYKKYSVPDNLQLHMLRVAAVGFVLSDLLENIVILDKEIILKELLLHDIGNIVKFDFSDHIIFSDAEKLDLKKIQRDFISKYGDEEHIATETIARELGVSDRVIKILKNSGSSNLDSTVESKDWNLKICSYADFRVAPYGIVSINGRFDDINKRYEGREHVLSDINKTEKKRKFAIILEKQIQEKINESLSLINDEKIRPIIEDLREYKL